MNPTTNLVSKNNNIRIIFRRNDPMRVTLAETHVTLLSSIKGKVKAESTEEDSIVPRPEDLRSIRSTSEGKQKSIREIESAETNSVSQELKNS